MTTHHRHLSTTQHRAAALAALAVGALVVLAQQTSPALAGGLGCIASGVVLGAVLVGPAQWARWRRLRAAWLRNDWPPLPDSDLSRPLAEVLPPLTRDALYASQEAPMTQPELLAPQPTDYAMPAAFVAQLEAQTNEPPIRSGRWLTVEQMRPGDQFVYAAFGAEEILTVGPVGVPAEVAQRWAARGLAPLAVEGEPLPMPLPLTDRWLMVRALRRAAVRCLVCGSADGFGERTYDLASPSTRQVEAVCLDCQRATTGGAP